MTDELTPELKAAVDATIGGAQRIAMKIVELPKEAREAAFRVCRRRFTEAIAKFGYDNEQGRAWVEVQVNAVRKIVAEIEASGGGGGGQA